MTDLRFAHRRAEDPQRATEPEYDVMSDGVTVWVNGAGGLLGRFGRNGIDVHQPLSVQQQTGSECLFCTNKPTTASDWDLFVSKMDELHGVQVPDKCIPTRFKKKKGRTNAMKAEG
jgi:hypothetical protein